MKINVVVLLLLGAVLLSSCATIVSGSEQRVRINSNPSSALILIDEIEVGKTPFEIKLERKREHHVMIKLDGYKLYETRFTKKFNAWYLGNILFGGIIGLVIDPITGAIYNLSPKTLQANLENEAVVVNSSRNNLYIAVSLEIDPDWEKIGQLEKL